MRLLPRLALGVSLALAATASAETTFYGNVRETLTNDPDCFVPSDPTGPEAMALAWFANADGTHRAYGICGSESFDPEVVWLLDFDSEGVTQRLAISWSGASDPPGLVDVALPDDASAVFERYGAPNPGWRWRPVAGDLTVGGREVVALYPQACGGITWTGTTRGFATSSTSLTAVVFGAANDGVVTYTRQAPNNWTCALKFTTPVVLPDGASAELVDDVVVDGARTVVALSDFPPVDRGIWDVASALPTFLMGPGVPIDDGDTVADVDQSAWDFAGGKYAGSVQRTFNAEYLVGLRSEFDQPVLRFYEPGGGTNFVEVDLTRDETSAINTGFELLADFSPLQVLHANGELLEGREILTFKIGRQARAGDLLVFTATFSDFSDGYFVAAFTGPPTVPALGGAGVLALAAALLIAAVAVLRLRAR